MTDETSRKFRKELMTGLSALVLLRVLEKSGQEMYGYEIAKAMKLEDESGAGEPLFKQGAIYPVLRSLDAAGLLSSRTQPSDSGPPRRYYKITKEGRAALAEWLTLWREMRNFVDDAVGTP